MKFGVKTYFDAGFAKYFEDKADFLEVMAICGEDYSFLEGYSLPIVIHAMHSGFGINFADKGLVEKNREAVDFAIELADKCGAEKIIVHAGRLVNENCSVEQVVDFLKGLDDRIIVENCPKDVCSIPDETSCFLFEVGRNFCFDVNHAISAAELSLKKDYLNVIRNFLKINPVHFHLSGQVLGKDFRDHLSFEDSEVDFNEIFGLLPKGAWVTLETTTDIGKVERDLDFVRGIENDIRS